MNLFSQVLISLNVQNFFFNLGNQEIPINFELKLKINDFFNGAVILSIYS